ncbi:MAG TPA: SDR family NAD(P)-dependent oxidoreductase [Saprospiraceae bacterium]|nr:SDR family NAD(P)-dependent oxidoreductase [Saprospiraceae bacterium]
MNITDSINLEGRVALITGASKGIGEAIALAMGKAGARIVISSRKQEALNETADRLRREGIVVLAVAANAGNSEDLKNLVTRTLESFDHIDIVVNNAAANPVCSHLPGKVDRSNSPDGLPDPFRPTV